MPEPKEIFGPIDHDLRVCGLAPSTVYAYLGTPELDPELVADHEPGAAVRSLAFHAQAAVLENLQEMKNGHAWPMCQGKHPHPMSLGSGREGTWPYWYCPKNPSYRFAVGEHPGR